MAFPQPIVEVLHQYDNIYKNFKSDDGCFVMLFFYFLKVLALFNGVYSERRDHDDKK